MQSTHGAPLLCVPGIAFGGSGFPNDKLGHAFITQSGATHASGTSSKAKLIEEWVLDPDGTRHVPAAGEPANPRDLVKYQGSGYSTAAAIAPGPGGLYFSTLYPDTNPDPIAAGAKISFSFNQAISSSFANQKVTFTATLYWATGTLYTRSNPKSGSFAVVP